MSGAAGPVQVLHVFSTFAAAGPQVRTVRLLPRLEPSWRHAIVALDGRTEARELLDPGLGVEVLPAPPKAGSLRTSLALARLLRARRPDLLLTYNWGAIDALVAARLEGLRSIVHHEDGFRPDEVAGFKRRRIWTRRLLLRRTRAVVVPSRTLGRIARELWKLPPGIVQTIPNGLDPAAYPLADGNPARRAELGIPATAPVVGWVGHLRPEKNPVRAVEAFAHWKDSDAHLLVLGEGPEGPAVQRAAQKLGVGARVHRVGHRSDPGPDYRAMDAFLISSDTEQMPVALLEAMASGLPVVATNVGDVAAILPPEQGDLVVEREAGALGAALRRLFASERRPGLGHLNRTRVAEQFSLDSMVAAYRTVYARALAS
jgi:glycosyltransferase involved in cell wall biosynthesis